MLFIGGNAVNWCSLGGAHGDSSLAFAYLRRQLLLRPNHTRTTVLLGALRPASRPPRPQAPASGHVAYGLARQRTLANRAQALAPLALRPVRRRQCSRCCSCLLVPQPSPPMRLLC